MRLEHDTMGEMEVPDDALWGASTQRAALNFQINGQRMPAALIRSLALVKLAAAKVNEVLGKLPADKSRLIQLAAREIAAGGHATQFPVEVFQSGSGTSTNMNVNEVIAHRAMQLAGRPADGGWTVHPNDDVNLGQSSNDAMPTALHLSVALALRDQLAPALAALAEALEAKSSAFAGIGKIGRTHLMDATPLTLGQEFSGYAVQARKAGERVRRAMATLGELAIGGTAVGTGLNAHPEFGARVCRLLHEETGLDLREATNHFEAQAARDDCVEVAGQLVAVAASLAKIANDFRLLGSGPQAGLAELRLPEVQPGSSIMPGKVNPVMCEMLVQVGHFVFGQAQTVATCGRDGQLELNATVPLIAHCLHASIQCLANGARAFAEKCVAGVEADAARCRRFMERSPMLATALTPALGYDVVAAVATEALATGRSVRDVVLARGLMDQAALDRALAAALPGKPTPISPPDSTLSTPESFENEGGHVIAMGTASSFANH